eukprot:gene4867-5945_t
MMHENKLDCILLYNDHHDYDGSLPYAVEHDVDAANNQRSASVGAQPESDVDCDYGNPHIAGAFCAVNRIDYHGSNNIAGHDASAKLLKSRGISGVLTDVDITYKLLVPSSSPGQSATPADDTSVIEPLKRKNIYVNGDNNKHIQLDGAESKDNCILGLLDVLDLSGAIFKVMEERSSSVQQEVQLETASAELKTHIVESNFQQMVPIEDAAAAFSSTMRNSGGEENTNMVKSIIGQFEQAVATNSNFAFGNEDHIAAANTTSPSAYAMAADIDELKRRICSLERHAHFETHQDGGRDVLYPGGILPPLVANFKGKGVEDVLHRVGRYLGVVDLLMGRRESMTGVGVVGWNDVLSHLGLIDGLGMSDLPAPDGGDAADPDDDDGEYVT